MRIGMLAPPWIPVPPPAYGGIEEVIDVLACGLSGLGHQVILAAHPASTCPVERIPVVPLAPSVQIGDRQEELRHVIDAYAAFEELRVDLVHDHTTVGPVYRRRPADMPVVTTAHGPFTAELQQHYRSVPPDVSIVAISRHQASTAGPVKVARVIHHGIDAEHIAPGDGAGGYLAFLGRMAPDKGVREAVEVARQAGVPLLIGAKMREAQEHKYFADVIEPLLGGTVEYLGELGTREKFDLLRSAMAMVNPLRWPEPFGMVMIEAMAVGTPVLATPEGSAPELIEDGVSGFLRSSIAGLAATVPLIADLDRRRVRSHVVRNFSKERMARLYEDYFRAVVGDNDQDLVGTAAGL
ncbi:glycosyltransferase family 4 protein [Parafrigoribacterium mesophilum]|uniref:glycosyltransferase n=1 Tax=Parafrigoribacterium mesophilum TaxID=433646 RepID=UPI0031FC2FCC